MERNENDAVHAFAVVNYVDLDNNMARIATSGRITAGRGYQPDKEIHRLANNGYELVTNGFAKQRFDGRTYLVTFKHQREIVTANNLAYNVQHDDVVKTGRQVVHYLGAGNQTPRDNVATVLLKRAILFDEVTKRRIGATDWQPEQANYPVIGSPNVQGFVPTKAMVGGKAIDPQQPDVTYTVNYQLVKHPSLNKQMAVVRFLDIDNQNKPILTPATVTGAANALIEYDPAATLKKLANKGYTLVDNGYNPDGTRQFFDADDNFTQTYIITLRHRHAHVSSRNPQEIVQPEQYQRDARLVVQFVGAGAKTPQPVVQTIRWTRDVTADLVTGELTHVGKWRADKAEYEAVPVPVIDGYHTDLQKVAGQAARMENTVIKVEYQPNGCIIPVDKQGRVLDHSKTIYRTDPADPTKAAADQPVPKISGYYTKEKTLTPQSAGKDTRVHYYATAVHAPLAIVNYIDMGDESRQLASSGLIRGEAGESIMDAYSTADELTRLKKRGYQVLYNNFDRCQETPTFRKDDLQTFTVALAKIGSASNLPNVLTKTQVGEIINAPQGDDMTVIFDALKSLNNLLGLVMKNNSK